MSRATDDSPAADDPRAHRRAASGATGNGSTGNGSTGSAATGRAAAGRAGTGRAATGRAATGAVTDTLASAADALGAAGEHLDAAKDAVVEAVKPRLRGWIHAGNAPLAIVGGAILTAFAPATAPRVSALVFAITAALLFGTSAVYHRGTWGETTRAALRRADHANIFLIIAGTYTPLAVLLLEKRTATILLVIVWSGALLGLGARMLWLGAPRWVYTPVYIALGWVAVGFLRQFWEAGGPAVVWLVAIGGLAYTGGAVVYALKRPNPSPRWFGFHEIFHVGTVIGFWCHFAAVAIAIAQIR